MAELFKALGGSLSDLLADYGLIGSIAIIVVMSSIQAIPSIKANPWTWIARKIGKALNGDVIDKVTQLEKQIKQIQEEQAAAKAAEEEKNAKQARVRILRFGDEIRSQARHTKEHFDDVLRDVSDYEEYCESHPHFKNNQARLTIENIKDLYRERLSKNDFL